MTEKCREFLERVSKITRQEWSADLASALADPTMYCPGKEAK